MNILAGVHGPSFFVYSSEGDCPSNELKIPPYYLHFSSANFSDYKKKSGTFPNTNITNNNVLNFLSLIVVGQTYL